MDNDNILNSYLGPSILSSSTSSIESIIKEKNILIEEYKLYIEQLTYQYKEESIKHSNTVSFYKLKLDSLQQKCDAITNGEIYDLIHYYETQIKQISDNNNKQIDTLKFQISLLLPLASASSSGFPDQSKPKKVISTLMVENSSLRKSNESLSKITRMNEVYKIVARKYENQIEEKEKAFSAYERDQCITLNSLSNDNKILKEQINEDRKTIKNLQNAIELIKTGKKDYKKCISSNVLLPSSNNTNRRVLTECNEPRNERNRQINASNIHNEYEDNKAEIELDIIKLDKCLNGSKMIIIEKTEKAKKALDKILNKIVKEKSAYKAILKKELGNIRDCIELMVKESIMLIKKANSSYIANESSKRLLKELIMEYEEKIKNNKSFVSNVKYNTNYHNKSNGQITLNKEVNDNTKLNNIEIAKRYLHTFE